MSRSTVPSDLSVGQMAVRAGVPVSTLHFYEAEGLNRRWRNPANHRRYDRSELRRPAIIKVAQAVGVSQSEARGMLDRLPRDRTVSARDWAEAAAPWRAMLDERIALMTRLRDQIGHCIGCGCLSLDSCPLYNAQDGLGRSGPGPRRWTGTAGDCA